MLTDALASVSGSYQCQAHYDGTCVTNAASPLQICKGSEREPWHISQASQEEIVEMGTPENTAVLSMHTQCPEYASSHPSSWSAPDLPASLCWEGLQALYCLEQAAWCKAVCKGPCCAELAGNTSMKTAGSHTGLQQAEQSDALPLGLSLMAEAVAWREAGCLCANGPSKHFFLLYHLGKLNSLGLTLK